MSDDKITQAELTQDLLTSIDAITDSYVPVSAEIANAKASGKSIECQGLSSVIWNAPHAGNKDGDGDG